mgnify:CR=1 FL=1
MMIAKVKGDKLLKFPYFMSDLSSENNNTNFDGRHDIFGWFKLSDLHLVNGEDLVEVKQEPVPDVDFSKNKATFGATPVFKDGCWVFECFIEARTQEELDEIAAYIPESTTYK